MVSSHSTVLDEVNLPPIPAGLLAGMNRRVRSDKLHESINHEYYWKRDGWVTVAEGHTTLQAERLIEAKGFRRIPRSPRPTVNAEMNAPFHALLRMKEGPEAFPVEQVIAHKWHKNPPVIFICREALNDDDHPEHTDECFKQVTFPQLRGLQIEEATCRTCHAYFVSVAGKTLLDADVQLRKHMEVSHTRQMQNDDIANAMAGALTKLVVPGVAAQGGGTLSPEMVAQIAAVVVATMAQVNPVGSPPPVAEPPNFEPVGDEEDEEAPDTVYSGRIQIPDVVNQPPVAPSAPARQKYLKDMNTAELVAYAAEREISLEGCETNKERLERIRAVQGAPAAE